MTFDEYLAEAIDPQHHHDIAQKHAYGTSAHHENMAKYHRAMIRKHTGNKPEQKIHRKEAEHHDFLAFGARVMKR